MGEEPAMTFVSCVKHDLSDDAMKCSDCHYELTLKQFADNQDEVYKRGFYAGQANAGVELEDCHQNWKKFNAPLPKETQGGNKSNSGEVK